ncbi:MAG: hypothetical protein J5858_01980, partial [Lentisphaeria bacterium]|nr:hypothetical protein [Lentisphaeria bacterium]
GSWGLAAVLSVMALSRIELPDRPPQWMLSKGFRMAGVLLAAAAVGATLFFLPPVVRAEFHYDALHSMSDPRFASDPGMSRPQPAVVRDALAKCDPRSPFPFAAASSYFLTLGPYYVSDALEMLDQAIALTPKRSAYYYRKYKILQTYPSRKAEADAALNKARELSPKNPQYYPDGVTPYGTRSY